MDDAEIGRVVRSAVRDGEDVVDVEPLTELHPSAALGARERVGEGVLDHRHADAPICPVADAAEAAVPRAHEGVAKRSVRERTAALASA